VASLLNERLSSLVACALLRRVGLGGTLKVDGLAGVLNG